MVARKSLILLREGWCAGVCIYKYIRARLFEAAAFDRMEGVG